MTPFAPHLANTLDVEKQRFANKWLFPWHNINIPGRTVEVEDSAAADSASVEFNSKDRSRHYIGRQSHSIYRQRLMRASKD
jgi:hypothetical protein